MDNDEHCYVVVWADTLLGLEKKVNDYVEKGYFPKGGICVTTTDSGTKSYYQAMFKEPAGAHW